MEEREQQRVAEQVRQSVRQDFPGWLQWMM
jgi:hypothetical protein